MHHCSIYSDGYWKQTSAHILRRYFDGWIPWHILSCHYRKNSPLNQLLKRNLIVLPRPKEMQPWQKNTLEDYLVVRQTLRRLNHLYSQATQELILAVESGQVDPGLHQLEITERVIGGQKIKGIKVDGK